MFQTGGKPESIDPHKPHSFRRKERRGWRGLFEGVVAGRFANIPGMVANAGTDVGAAPWCGDRPHDLIHAPPDD